jgi:hypothetical protein
VARTHLGRERRELCDERDVRETTGERPSVAVGDSVKLLLAVELGRKVELERAVQFERTMGLLQRDDLGDFEETQKHWK